MFSSFFLRKMFSGRWITVSVPCDVVYRSESKGREQRHNGARGEEPHRILRLHERRTTEGKQRLVWVEVLVLLWISLMDMKIEDCAF